MTGSEILDEKQNKMTDNVIASNPDKPYLEGYRYFINDSSSTTVYNYVRHIVKFMDFCNKNIEELKVDDYTRYLSSIKSTTSSNQIVVYAALKKFSLYLLANNINNINPMQYVKRPKFKESIETKEKRNIGYLNKDEIKTYIDTVETGVGSKRAINRQKEWKDRDLLIILIFLNTGMRRSALCKLDVDNLDLDNKKLNTIDKGEVTQIYDISDDLIYLINCWLNKRTKILGNSNEKALFISNQKTRLNKSAIASIVKKYAKNIEAKNITPHKLRATYGTLLYEETKDLFFTQECMGHSNPKTTELYIRGQKDASRKKASVIMSSITVK